MRPEGRRMQPSLSPNNSHRGPRPQPTCGGQAEESLVLLLVIVLVIAPFEHEQEHE